MKCIISFHLRNENYIYVVTNYISKCIKLVWYWVDVQFVGRISFHFLQASFCISYNTCQLRSYIQRLGLVTQTATIRCVRNVHINYIPHCARKCVLELSGACYFSTELEDTFKWTLLKPIYALLSAPKEPLFSDMVKSTVVTGVLDASSKNQYLYCKNYLPW